jgi:hypothetical protein
LFPQYEKVMQTKPTDPDQAVMRELQKMPNIGKACAKDLLLLGIRSCEELKGRDPDELYQSLCEKTGQRHDPCVWDTLASVVHFAETGERKPWWDFTAVRKARGLQL